MSGEKRAHLAAIVASTIFTVIVPSLVFAMIKVDPSVGWPLVGISVLVGIAILVWGFSPHHIIGWRKKVWPLVLMGCGFCAYSAGAIWYYARHSAPVERLASAPLPSPGLGSLQFVTLHPRVQRKFSTKQTAVQMAAELKNTNPFILKFHAKMKGAVNKVGPNPWEIELDGYIPANETMNLLYSRIDNVPVNETPEIGQPVLAGVLEYDIQYWAAENPDGAKRRTSRTAMFEMMRPFSKEPLKEGEYRRSEYKSAQRVTQQAEE